MEKFGKERYKQSPASFTFLLVPITNYYIFLHFLFFRRPFFLSHNKKKLYLAKVSRNGVYEKNKRLKFVINHLKSFTHVMSAVSYLHGNVFFKPRNITYVSNKQTIYNNCVSMLAATAAILSVPARLCVAILQDHPKKCFLTRNRPCIVLPHHRTANRNTRQSSHL